jgi:ABC-2 type transport system permease protein
MAVHKRTYRGYSGGLTPAWSRFLILYRQGSRGLFRSRFLTIFLVACFFPPLIMILAAYLNHNTTLLLFMDNKRQLFAVDAGFFLLFLQIQGAFAFVLTAFLGPGLISPDLSNGALPLYLCRPFSRAEYILGKMSVLFVALSEITWIPGLILFFIEASLDGSKWMFDNLRIAGAILVGSLIWIAILSLIALAMSAWVRWRLAAGALILGVFFLSAGLHGAILNILVSQYGVLVNPAALILMIYQALLGIPWVTAQEAQPGPTIGDAWMALAVMCGICLFLLVRKVRAVQVVK